MIVPPSLTVTRPPAGSIEIGWSGPGSLTGFVCMLHPTGDARNGLHSVAVEASASGKFASNGAGEEETMLKKLLLSTMVPAFAMIASAAYAQYAPVAQQPAAGPSPITRTILQTTDYPNAPYQVVEAFVVIAPGATAARHTHPGVEVAYVVEGEGDLIVAGQPTKHVKAGDSFMNPAGVPHSFKNTSADKPVKLVSTYVVDKTKPLASAAPE